MMSGRMLKQVQQHRLERGVGWLCARRPPIVVGEEAGRCGRPKCLVVAVKRDCTGILLLYFQQQRLPPNRCEPLACGNTSRGDRI